MLTSLKLSNQKIIEQNILLNNICRNLKIYKDVNNKIQHNFNHKLYLLTNRNF